MKIFISWSQDHSHDVAKALAEWIPQVLNEVVPFISSGSESGTRWASEIAVALDGTNFGIVCTTPKNQHNAWLNFEAGALAKSLGEDTRVVPLLIGMEPEQLSQPLAQFNGVVMGKDGIVSLMNTMNNATTSPRGPVQLGKALDIWWPVLEKELNAITANPDEPKAADRSDHDILLEVLDTLRGLARAQGHEENRARDEHFELADMAASSLVRGARIGNYASGGASKVTAQSVLSRAAENMAWEMEGMTETERNIFVGQSSALHKAAVQIELEKVERAIADRSKRDRAKRFKNAETVTPEES